MKHVKIPLLLIASAIGPLPALADDAFSDGGSGAELEDVIVTATRQATSLEKTPLAISVVTSEEIARRAITTARDLAGSLPGVTLPRSGITPLTQVFFVRGIGESDPIFDPAIAQYVDDVYLPRAINGLSDLTDVERVEVLRGPQGTLFGDNSDAGAIRYITRDPGDDTRFSADAAVGNYTTVQAHAYLSGALLPGALDGSVAVARDQHNGYSYDPTIASRVNDQSTSAIRAKLLLKDGASFTALLTLDATRDNSSTAYYTPVLRIVAGTLAKPVYAPGIPGQSYASQEPVNHSWTDGASLRLTAQISPHLTAKSITAARQFAQDPVNYNNDGEPLVPYNAAHPAPVSIADNFIVYRDKEWTEEAQLLGQYDRFDFATGVFLLYENFSSNRIGYVVNATGLGKPAFPFDQIGDTRTGTGAVYAQGNYHITGRLTATLGLRYTNEHRDFNFQGVVDGFGGLALPAGSPGAAADFTFAAGKTWHSLTPKYGVQYALNDDAFGYASVSKGFRAGGFNNRAISLASALPYDEESVTTYEAGLKTHWLANRLLVNATAFYNDYQDLQQTATVISPVNDTPVSVRTNAGSARTSGFELESIAIPLPALRWTNDVSYLNTRYERFPNAGGAGISATGNQLPYAPRWTLYSELAYTLPLALPGETRAGADVSYETGYFSDVLNRPQNIIHPQGYVDAFLSETSADRHWTTSLIGRNLGNRREFQSLSYAGSKNSWEGPVTPPFTILLKVDYAL